MELTFWTAGVNFGVNLDLVLVLILELILELTFNPVFGVHLAGVIFLTLIDAQGRFRMRASIRPSGSTACSSRCWSAVERGPSLGESSLSTRRLKKYMLLPRADGWLDQSLEL